jgi:hypothetical protein
MPIRAERLEMSKAHPSDGNGLKRILRLGLEARWAVPATGDIGKPACYGSMMNLLHL